MTDRATAIDNITPAAGICGSSVMTSSSPVGAGGILRDTAHQIGAVMRGEVQRLRNRDRSREQQALATTTFEHFLSIQFSSGGFA